MELNKQKLCQNSAENYQKNLPLKLCQKVPKLLPKTAGITATNLGEC